MRLFKNKKLPPKPRRVFVKIAALISVMLAIYLIVAITGYPRGDFGVSLISANTTAVTSDNFTISTSDNFTINIGGLDQALIDGSEAGADLIVEAMNSRIDDIIGLILVLAITAAAYWRRWPVLCYLSGLVLLFYAWSYYDTDMAVGLILGVIGLFNFAVPIVDRRKD